MALVTEANFGGLFLMLNPISFNVIRQALRTSGMPAPTRITNITAYHGKYGPNTALYQVEFSTLHVVLSWAADLPHLQYDKIAWLRSNLAQCFCADIEVGNVWPGGSDGATICATLLIRPDPATAEEDDVLSWLVD